MRLFVAVGVDDALRAMLAPLREAMQDVLSRAAVPPRVTWVMEDAAHVTLRFIGEVPQEVATAVAEALSRGFDLEPFDVRWDHLGTFPGGRTPRVVWLGATAGVEQLGRLAQRVEERLSPIVGPGKARPFNAHVTIGRVKAPGSGVDWQKALAAARVEPTTTRVDHVTLYESRLSSRGPTYTALCRAPL